MKGHPISLGRAWNLLDPIIARVRQVLTARDDVVAVGSLRRVLPIVDDLVLLVIADSPAAAIDAFLLGAAPPDVMARTTQGATLRVRNEIVHLHVVPRRAAGPALISSTGSSTHHRMLRERARAQGLELSGTGLSRDGSVIECPDEDAVYGALHLPFIPPEVREHGDELQAAEAGTLPQLVTATDIKGDLHVHTNWSDGRHTMTDMVGEAVRLGYEYVAITDHSQSSSIANGLDADALLEQQAEVEQVRRAFPAIRVLHGSEVDILPDGSLDFPDDILSQLDIVLASLHDPAGHSRRRLTERYLAAMRHPFVHIVTHPANRMVGSDPGYDLDFDALFREAVGTQTIMEVDGAPIHLDMDGAVARRAVEAGVMVSVDSDCHHADRLGRQMAFGVGTARRGWIEARHVLNTRPLPALIDLLGRKRGAPSHPARNRP